MNVAGEEERLDAHSVNVTLPSSHCHTRIQKANNLHYKSLGVSKSIKGHMLETINANADLESNQVLKWTFICSFLRHVLLHVCVSAHYCSFLILLYNVILNELIYNSIKLTNQTKLIDCPHTVSFPSSLSLVTHLHCERVTGSLCARIPLKSELIG